MRSVLAGAAAIALSAPGAALAAGVGESLFLDNCAACHQKTGAGVKGAFPALAGNKLVQGPPVVLASTVLLGRGGMPAFKSELDDGELAAILSYVRTAWGNKGQPLTAAQVAAVRTKASAVSQPKSLQAH